MDDVIERIARHLRRPVQIDPALDGRVMHEINALPTPGGATPLRKAWGWLRRPHQVTLTPLGGLAAAAVLAIVILLSRMGSTPPAPPLAESRGFQFVLVAPRATQVSLVGDFNDWDATRTPMRRTGSEALWTVVVPLMPGRYHYAFFVDGSRCSWPWWSRDGRPPSNPIRGSSGWTPPRGRPLRRSSIRRAQPCSPRSHWCSARSKARPNAPPGTRSSPPCGAWPRTWATPATRSGRRRRQPSSPRGLRRSEPGRPKRPSLSCGALGESPLPCRSRCSPISWRAESPSTARPLPYSASPRGPETRTWSSSVAPSSVTSLWAPPPLPPPRPR